MSKFDELKKLAEAATPGPWKKSEQHGARGGVEFVGGFVAFTCAHPRKVNDTRSDGESWLDMRHRTQAKRDAIDSEALANNAFIAAANPAAILELLAIQAQLVAALSHPALYELLGNVEDSMDSATWSKAVVFMEARDAALAAAGAQP